MFSFLVPLLKPAAMLLIGQVVKRVFKAEAVHGPGTGDSKLADVVSNITGTFSGVAGVNIEPSEVINLVKAVVELLNTIGAFDDEPGFDFSDLELIWENVQDLVVAVTDLVD